MEASSMPDDGWPVTVKHFASLFGTKGQPKDHQRPASQITQMFAKSAAPNDVVLVVPSFELKMDGDDDSSNSVLPEVGQHALSSGVGDSLPAELLPSQSHVESPTSTPPHEQQQQRPKKRPSMEASVINMAAPTTDDTISVEQKAADSIGQPTCWTRSTVGYAPQAVACNLSESFTVLVNSRLRAWTLLLLKHSLATPPTNHNHNNNSSDPAASTPARSRLLHMLAAKISVQGAAETNYQTLPLPESAAGVKPTNADVVLPLLFEVVLRLQVQEKDEAVTLRAPGTVTGTWFLLHASVVRRSVDSF